MGLADRALDPADQALAPVGRAARASDPGRLDPSALADSPWGQPAPSASAAGLGPRVLPPA